MNMMTAHSWLSCTKFFQSLNLNSCATWSLLNHLQHSILISCHPLSTSRPVTSSTFSISLIDHPLWQWQQLLNIPLSDISRNSVGCDLQLQVLHCTRQSNKPWGYSSDIIHPLFLSSLDIISLDILAYSTYKLAEIDFCLQTSIHRKLNLSIITLYLAMHQNMILSMTGMCMAYWAVTKYQNIWQNVSP